MRFSWDERKRRLNLKEHGLDFVDALSVFEGPTSPFEDDRLEYDEQRFVTLGFFAGVVVSMVHTESPPRIHVISFERRHEMKKPSSSRTSKTDLSRVRAMTNRQIKVSAEHPEVDVRHIVRGIVRRGLQPVSAKTSISLRVDADVLEWFKAQGRGYQTRINAVLRAFKDASL